jgi:hypothetical protein
MSFSSGSRFVVGINNAWFAGQYDHDLGYNQFSGSRVYRNPVPDPSLQDTSPEKPYISSNQGDLFTFFSSVQTSKKNLQVIRVWTFERFEGLQFDSNLVVTGLDPEFVVNLVKLLDAANSNGVQVYLCLFDFWAVFGAPSQDITSAGRTSDYANLQNTWKKITQSLFKDNTYLGKFTANALVPLINQIGGHPALFAIDLTNEPECLMQNDSMLFADIQNFIAQCSNSIRSANSTIKISCGFQNSSTITNNAVTLAQYLDFFDFHLYNEDGSLPQYLQSDFAGKPCIIGECGYPVGKSPYDNTKEAPVAQSFLNNANTLGYAGCLLWIVDYINKDLILQKTQAFADTTPLIQKQQQKKGCFIATAAMGSELHPHVQILREYRDNVLLKSPHRKQFEKMLDVYYSFSPEIAESMKQHKSFSHVMKYIVVYPVVLSLKILVKIFGNSLK